MLEQLATPQQNSDVMIIMMAQVPAQCGGPVHEASWMLVTQISVPQPSAWLEHLTGILVHLIGEVIAVSAMEEHNIFLSETAQFTFFPSSHFYFYFFFKSLLT